MTEEREWADIPWYERMMAYVIVGVALPVIFVVQSWEEFWRDVRLWLEDSGE